jgi:hypothetical protein
MHTQISNAPQHALNRAVSLNRAKSMSTSTSNSNISNSNQHASASAKVSASSAHDTHLAPGNAPARRPSRSKVSAAPLVDLGNQPVAGSALLQRNAGFTGKGLLGKI